MAIHDLDLKGLLFFREVSTRGGFASAQASLGVSQSSISERIARLEGSLGVRLCERGRSGFQVTDAGEAVLAASIRLFGAIEEFELATSELSERLSGRIGIGVIDNTVSDPSSPLVSALGEFSKRDHNVYIDLVVESPEELQQQVLGGQLHAAIGPFPARVGGLTYRTLYTEKVSPYTTPSHPIHRVRSVEKRREALLRTPSVTVGYLERQRRDTLGEVRARVDNMEACAMLLLSGRYVGFLPDHFAARWVGAKLLRRVDANVEQLHDFALALPKGRSRSRALVSFISDLGNVAQ